MGSDRDILGNAEVLHLGQCSMDKTHFGESKGINTGCFTTNSLGNKPDHKEKSHMLLNRTWQMKEAVGKSHGISYAHPLLCLLPILCTSSCKGAQEPSKACHRITERLKLEGTPRSHFVQLLLKQGCQIKQGNLHQVAHKHAQMAFHQLQGWRYTSPLIYPSTADLTYTQDLVTRRYLLTTW